MVTGSPISFARGAPSLDIVAVDDLRAAADRAFQNDPAGTFSYGTSGGYLPLRDWIAQQHGRERENVIVTNGSMQADAFLFQQLVRPGDTVVVEAPTYDRTLLALRELGAEILAIPLEPDGIDVEALARALESGARPRLAHVIPNFQNPAGYTLSLDKRRRLLDLAENYEFVIFEDNTYVSPNMVAQSIVNEFCRSGAIETSIETVKNALRERRDALAAALERDLPEASFVPPEGGYFMWVELPEGADVDSIAAAAKDRGLVFVKGTDFLIEGGLNTLRIAYSGVTPEQIDEGVGRLADAYRGSGVAAA
jgi:DNA-binding transcriptional MocR family regulator